MALSIEDARILIKTSTVTTEEPTVAPSNNHTDGSWDALDIYVGEMFINVADSKIWYRSNSGIIQILDTSDAGLFIPLTGSSVITGDLKYTKGSDANFGTADNYGLNILTNNTTRVTINNSGFVGINNTSPNYRFDLEGTANDFVYNSRIRNASNGANAGNAILVSSDNANLEIGILGSATTAWGGYGGAGKTFIRAGVNSNGINIITDPSTSGKVTFWSRLHPTTDAAFPSLDINGNTVGMNKVATTGVVLYVRGETSNNSASALKIDNIANANLLDIINDGTINIGYNANVKGTAGAGFVGIVAQSSNASAPSATGLKLFSASDGHFSWVVKNGSDTFVRKIGGTLTADRTKTLQDTTGTIAELTDIVNTYSFGYTLYNPSASTVYYFDGRALNYPPATSSTIRRFRFLNNGILKSIVYNLYQNANGSAEDVLIYLRNESTTTDYLVLTYQSNFGTGASTGFVNDVSASNIAVNTTDLYTIKIVTPAWGTLSTQNIGQLVMQVKNT